MNFNQENIMKTQHLYFAAFAILFASCAKQEADMSPVQSDNELRTFVADFEQTKTNLAQDEAGVYRKMIWSAGDKVGIFDASGEPQPFETKTGGASVTYRFSNCSYRFMVCILPLQCKGNKGSPLSSFCHSGNPVCKEGRSFRQCYSSCGKVCGR